MRIGRLYLPETRHWAVFCLFKPKPVTVSSPCPWGRNSPAIGMATDSSINRTMIEAGRATDTAEHHARCGQHADDIINQHHENVQAVEIARARPARHGGSTHIWPVTERASNHSVAQYPLSAVSFPARPRRYAHQSSSGSDHRCSLVTIIIDPIQR